MDRMVPLYVVLKCLLLDDVSMELSFISWDGVSFKSWISWMGMVRIVSMSEDSILYIKLGCRWTICSTYLFLMGPTLDTRVDRGQGTLYPSLDEYE